MKIALLTASRRVAWFTLGTTLLLASLAIVVLPTPEPFRSATSSGLPDRYQSVQAESRQRQLPSSRTRAAVVVLSRPDRGPLTDEQLAATGLVDRLRPLAHGGQVVGPEPAPNRRVATISVPVASGGAMTELTKAVSAIRSAVRSQAPPGLNAEVTGEPAFAVDLDKEASGANARLLLVTLGVVILILLLTYRSPVLWLVPVGVIALAEQLTLRLVDNILPALKLSSDPSTKAITSILVFGVATDYALLLIARYRDELRRQHSRFAAMAAAVTHTSHAVLASGLTVVLALLALVLATFEPSRALGAAGACGVLVAMAFALVVLPAALAVFPRSLFWPAVPRPGGTPNGARLWQRIGDLVAARPRTILAASGVFLSALAAGGIAVPTGLSQAEQFRVKPEAVRAADRLVDGFPAGALEPATIYTTPGAVSVVQQAVAGIPGVASATRGEASGPVATVAATFEAKPSTARSFTLIREVRATVAKIPGAQAVVGGQEATNVDLHDAQLRDRKLIVSLILAAIFLVLVVVLRSLVAPLILLATVIISFFASYGASWLVFDRLLDFRAVDESVPLLSFLFLVALGVDYNIFLVTRAQQEAKQHGHRAGMLIALRRTGGVITSAGLLLAAVFAALGLLPIITLTQIGVVVCIGVLLDTLLVRTVVVPASALLLDQAFWWPRRIAVQSPAYGQASDTPIGRQRKPSELSETRQMDADTS